MVNFLDRLTISVLAPVIVLQFGLTNLQFASISSWFLVAYTIGQGVSGKLFDRVGTRRGFSSRGASAFACSRSACNPRRQTAASASTTHGPWSLKPYIATSGAMERPSVDTLRG